MHKTLAIHAALFNFWNVHLIRYCLLNGRIIYSNAFLGFLVTKTTKLDNSWIKQSLNWCGIHRLMTCISMYSLQQANTILGWRYLRDLWREKSCQFNRQHV